MSEPRLPLLSAEDAQTAAIKVGIPEAKAGILLYRGLLQHPVLAQRINDLMETLTTDSDLDARLRELMVMRVGWLNNGVYEFSLHWFIATQIGVPDHELRAIRDWQNHSHWAPADRAALQATDEVVTSGTMTQETWDECAKYFESPHTRLDLVSTILVWKMMSDLILNLEVPFETGFDAWPPNGISPPGTIRKSQAAASL